MAVDLGCGAGIETLELLRRGWQVHAVDSDPGAIELLEESVPAVDKARVHLHLSRLEAFALPRCDLIWAGYSLPYCAPHGWPDLWHRMVRALRPNGRFAGDIFGELHAWSGRPGIFTLSEERLREQLAGLTIEAFDVENGVRPSAGRLTRWHSFGIAVRKATRKPDGSPRIGA